MADFAHDDYILLANFKLQDILNTLHTWGFDRSQFPHFFYNFKARSTKTKNNPPKLPSFHNVCNIFNYLITCKTAEI